MNDSMIYVENMGKRYHIGLAQQRHDTLRDALMAGVHALRGRLRRDGRGSKEAEDTIWALRDVSFEVQQGEVVGIIGRNGAGKSTLLKILSRITRPTQGKAVVRGRVGSLLEVGTGFHPELTGRENVYLNGAILGMRRAEIERKFDEIVAFAEIERFLDTPVKRYSSGMYVRLAFAVAAHLEPEVLLVDEVLAVGDAGFQKKCLGKMGDVAQQGRTVLFVSHNMVAVQSLCSRAMWLDEGRIVQEGRAGQVVSSYLGAHSSTQSEKVWDDIATAPGNDKVRLYRACIRPLDGAPYDPLSMETPLAIEVDFWNLVPEAKLHLTLHLYTEQQVVAFTTSNAGDPVWGGQPLPEGFFRGTCLVPAKLLNSGLHRVLLLVVQDGRRVIYRHEDLLSFDVLDLRERSGTWYGKEPGVVQPLLEWTTEFLGDTQTGGVALLHDE